MLPPNFPSDTRQHDVLKAFAKLGWEILPAGYGKGSHRMARDPKSGTVVTVQYKIYREVIKSYLKLIDELGYDVNEFIRHL